MARETSEAPPGIACWPQCISAAPRSSPEIVQEQNRAVGFSPRAQLEGTANGPQAKACGSDRLTKNTQGCGMTMLQAREWID